MSVRRGRLSRAGPAGRLLRFVGARAAGGAGAGGAARRRLPLRRSAADLPDGARVVAARRDRARLGRPRRHGRLPAAVGGRGRGRELLPAPGLRPRRHPGGAGGRRPAARRQLDQPAGGEERLPLAGALLAEEGPRGGLHPADRGAVEQAPDHGGLSQRRRDGRGRLRRRGRGAALLGPFRRRARAAALGAADGGAAGPARPLAGVGHRLHRPARRRRSSAARRRSAPTDAARASSEALRFGPGREAVVGG